jgi:hypothetical protein
MSPLTSIRGYAEGIEDGTVDPREGAAALGREAARLERQGVLEVRREPVDLVAVAREASSVGVENLPSGGAQFTVRLLA